MSDDVKICQLKKENCFEYIQWKKDNINEVGKFLSGDFISIKIEYVPVNKNVFHRIYKEVLLICFRTSITSLGVLVENNTNFYNVFLKKFDYIIKKPDGTYYVASKEKFNKVFKSLNR